MFVVTTMDHRAVSKCSILSSVRTYCLLLYESRRERVMRKHPWEAQQRGQEAGHLRGKEQYREERLREED